MPNARGGARAQWLPSGDIVLDKRHWAIQRNPARVWLCSAGVPRDLVTGRLATLVGAATASPTSRGVMGYLGAAAANYWTDVQAPVLAGQSQWTIFAVAQTPAFVAGNGQVVYGERAASGNDIISLENTNQIRATLRNDGGTLVQQAGGPSIITNLPLPLAWTMNSTVASGGRLFVDGALATSFTWASNFTMTNAVVPTIGGDVADSTRGWRDWIGLVALWPGIAFSDAEIMQLSQNYAAMFRQRARSKVGVAAAAGSAAFAVVMA